MPYIKLTTTAKVTDDKCALLKAKFGKAIESFAGKNESWLMVAVDDGKRMWFKGDNSADTAMVDVELLGDVDAADSETMTVRVCEILNETLGIAPERIYVKDTGYRNWGWNKMNV